MTLASTVVFEVRVTGSDGNGGGYDPALAGTDRSQQNAAQVAIDNSTIVCTTPAANSNVLTFVSGYTPSAADLGNCVQIAGGTNVNPGVYEITAQTSTTWTLSGATNLTTATAGGLAITGAMGGAFASPAIASKYAAAGNTVFVKYNATAYPVSNTANVAGGKFVALVNLTLVGYDVTRTTANSDANRPTFAAAANNVQDICDNAFTSNIIANANGHSGCNGFGSMGSGTFYRRCEVIGCSVGFVNQNGAGMAEQCEASGCTSESYAFGGGSVYTGCLADGQTGAGACYYLNSGLQTLLNCAAVNAPAGAVVVASGEAIIRGMSILGTTGVGIDMSAAPAYCEDCVVYGSSTYNFKFGATYRPFARLVNCAGGGAGTADYDATGVQLAQIESFTHLTASPFVSSSDLGLNATAGGGAACKQAGASQALLSATAAAPDIGAVQAGSSAPGVPQAPLIYGG